MPERTEPFDTDALLHRILNEPSTAAHILTTTADALDRDSFLVLNTLCLDYAATIGIQAATSHLPDIVASEALAAATRALPQGRPGETCGEYALRLRAAARGMR